MDAHAVNFAELSDAVETRGAELRVFVLDACHDNPFPRAPGGRSIGLARGLGNIRRSQGEFVIFAAAPGELALDYISPQDNSSNSVFTRVFLKHFREGAYLENVANDVQADVLELSRQANYEQEPYYTDGVAGKACVDEVCGATMFMASPDPELEATYWWLCETRDTAAYCQAYVDEFPQGPRAPLARIRIGELTAAEASLASAPEPSLSTSTPQLEITRRRNRQSFRCFSPPLISSMLSRIHRSHTL